MEKAIQILGENNPETDWLDKLQKESWQAEMLVSGGALFGLISIYSILNSLSNQLVYSFSIDPFFITFPLTIISWGVFILCQGFGFHLLLRGYWIGLLGVNYAYPKGIIQEKLRFAGRFADQMDNRINNHHLLKVDQLCSVVFGFTYLTLFTLFSVGLFFLVYAMLDSIKIDSAPWTANVVQIAKAAFLLAGGLLVIDFLFFNFLRKARLLSRVIYPFHYLLSRLTLSFTYRKLYLTIVSNDQNRFLIPILVTLSIITTVLFREFGEPATSLSRELFPYRSLSSNSASFLEVKNHGANIEYFDLNIKHLPRYEEDIIELWNSESSNRKISQLNELNHEEQMKLISRSYRVFIDSILITNIEWIPEVRQFDNFFNSKYIVLGTQISTEFITSGKHKISIKLLGTSKDYMLASDSSFASKYIYLVK